MWPWLVIHIEFAPVNWHTNFVHSVKERNSKYLIQLVFKSLEFRILFKRLCTLSFEHFPNIFYNVEIRALCWPWKSVSIVFQLPLLSSSRNITWWIVHLKCPPTIWNCLAIRDQFFFLSSFIREKGFTTFNWWIIVCYQINFEILRMIHNKLFEFLKLKKQYLWINFFFFPE